MGRGKPKSVNGGRGGHKTAENSSSFGALNLPKAPVFYPTEEEFSDPLRFIEKIRGEAEPYGICRIVPPKCWKPPFARDLHAFSFPTKLQAIHQLQERPATCDTETFELEYGRFLDKEGGRRPRNRPVFQGQELDLCKLFNAVKRHGGFDKVVEEKKWAEVLRIVNPSAVNSAHHTSVLCQLYETYLYDYEIYQMYTSSGKRMRKVKRGTKRALGESTSTPHPYPKGKRRRRSCQESNVVDKKTAASLPHAKVACENKPLKEENSNLEPRTDQICEQCQSGLHEELMLLCDRCDRGWHLYCLSPPLEAVPVGNWYCLDCLNSERDSFGFSPGELYSLDAFRRLADRFKRKWLGSNRADHAEIERRFWEIVEGSAGAVEVMYGSDLDTSMYGSGFPRPCDEIPSGVDPKVWEEHTGNPWNLNNFPKLQGSMLRLVHDNIAGVMVPWLYIGMLFSSFCWHFEDHCFYSINYLHWGEPKCWYSVPGSAAEAFEQVMRKAFPDLFEAQPDLLFQLVTMLNPTVLKGSGVPVYTTLQEPGNFVITFPRSFHGGFNCGLNCAEAVNFAPADWLPHGGFGVELYRLYHKSAILSHEELLCVVAKSGCSPKTLPFLKKELIRVINSERTHREQLWKNGIVRISRMTSRKHPEYVGTEEDPECIICRYSLHLSAVVCSCRPGASVCVQHAERLCECNPDQQCLLYRYTMAELDDLLLMGDQRSADQDGEVKDSRVRSRRISTQKSTPLQTKSLVKKVKGRHVTHTELAEAWLTSARNMLRSPISQANIEDLLKQAEQFLWAGHEMDPVRAMEKDLIRAQKWVQDLTGCLSTVESWMHEKSRTSSKVPLKFAQGLIEVDEVPCIEPGFPKLKAMVEDANTLEQEIKSALSSSSPVKIAELEDLHVRAMEFPFELVEARSLQNVINSAKVWVERAKKYLSGKRNHLTSDTGCDQNINILYDLKSEVSKIPVQLPEMDLLENLIQRVEMWQGHARELLNAPLKLPELEVVLQDAEDFPVSTPELYLLRQYKSNALSWIEHCHNILGNIHQQTDYSKAVEDLTSILTEGRTLRVIVEQLDIVESELRKFLWREKASKALARRLPLKILEELMTEVSMLKLPNESLVFEVSSTIEAAYSWEQSANYILQTGACISEFEDLIRKSDDIHACLPTLSNIKAAVSTADAWLENAKPFLDRIVRVRHTCGPPLSVDVLQELLEKSKFLRVSLKEPDLLRAALKNAEAWCSQAAMLQASANLLLKSQYAWDDVYENSWDRNNLMLKLEELIDSLQCAVNSGLTLGFEFDELTKLKDVSAALIWNLKALSFSSKSPSVEDVESLINDARNLPIMPREYKLLESSLHESKRWLMKAFSVLPGSSSQKKCTIQDLEDLVAESQKLKISFPIKVGQIETAIGNHRDWQKQVQMFFDCKSGITWTELLQLKEIGVSSIVEDAKLEMLLSKIADIGSWILHCKAVICHSASSSVPLRDFLLQIKDSLDRALRKFRRANSSDDMEDFCICNRHPREEIKSVIRCAKCKDRYHCLCLGLTPAQTWATGEYICPFCSAVTSGTLANEETYPKVSKRNRPTLDDLMQLLNEAEGLNARVEEVELVESIVEHAKEWQSYLKATITHALVQQDKNSGFDSGRLVIALKTIEVAEVREQESSKIEVALSINSWRNRAKMLLGGPAKPYFRHIRRALKEGLSLHVASKDYFIQELRRLEHTASLWAVRAKQVVADHGALELDEVFKLIAEGESVPVDFGKLLAALKVRSVLYCICRKPYDEERAMIACDRCSEWYHFDCINLPEPDSSDEGCELLLQRECGPSGEFICPVCKPTQMQECSALHPKIDDYDSEFTSGEVSREGDGVTPPFEFVRGKRRSRLSGKSRSNLQERLKGNFNSRHQESSDMPSKDKKHPENPLTASGRPCRRTAGQNSKFESFVLLMHSR
eukprot:Gb_26073 [translate_table: standard]